MQSRSSISIAAGLLMVMGLTAQANATLTVQNFWHMGEDGLNNPSDSVGGKNFNDGFSTQVDTAVHAPGSTASVYYNGFAGNYMDNPTDGPTVPATNFVLELYVNLHTLDGCNIASLGTGTSGWAKIGFSGNNFFFGRENEAYGALDSHVPTVDTWYHLAFVQYGGLIHGFVNGVAADLPNYDNPTASTGNNGQMHIGVKPGGGQNLNGWVDNVRFSTFAEGQFNPNDLLVNAVPEPATMLGLGLGVAAMLRRRKRA